MERWVNWINRRSRKSESVNNGHANSNFALSANFKEMKMKVVDRKMVSYSPVVGEWETTIEGTTEDIGKILLINK